jgi:GNAT superfamily N-acetyltransferase
VSKNNSYHLKKVEDFCLRDNRWISLDWRLNYDNLPQLKKELLHARQFAKKRFVNKIEILLPIEISQELSKFLYAENFKPALVELKFDLEKFSQTAYKIANLNFSNQIKNKQALKELLIEQANFHYQNLPDYYLAAQEINWFFYLRQVLNDASKENGLLFLINDKRDLSALILGEYLGKTAFIWELVVSQKKRHFHLGSFLLNQYLAKLKDLGINRVYLETMSDSYARSWYQHQGFSEVNQSWFSRLK